MFELVIRNGMVLDGTGKPAVHADVAIDQQTVQFVGQGDTISAAREINASGLIVAPGFIDMHSHSDLTLFFQPDAQSKIRQGVTTEVVGNCGVSCAPVRAQHREALLRQFEANNFTMTVSEKAVWKWPSQMDYMRELVKKGISSNLISLVGGVPLRVAAAGMKEHLEPQELDTIKSLLQEELRQGIWGMSSGLYYVPGSYFTDTELVELCKVIKEHGAMWAIHMRDEGQGLFDAVNEVISIANKSGVSVQISHLKLEGKSNWRRAEELLAMLHDARANGVHVSWDQYPYTAYCSGLVDVIPPSLRGSELDSFVKDLGSKKVRESLKEYMLHGVGSWHSPLEEVDWKKMMIAEVKHDKELVGKTLEEIAKENRTDPLEAILDLLRSQEACVKVVVHAMSENDVEVIMKDPATMISSDGKAVSPWGRYAEMHPHPRYYGAFPRVLGRYVRENKVLDLPEAVRKMTSLPASRLGLRNRGVLKPGNAADIVIFDPGRISDKATFDNPHQFPCGIEYVIVNGKVVIGEGKLTGTYSGRLLTHDG
ncbi:D-aminoacylase [Candidatus Bipolaricaulota bacterium]|nr:D-aminoacylase [Candidatus Bipolaricaulota bacterium]